MGVKRRGEDALRGCVVVEECLLFVVVPRLCRWPRPLPLPLPSHSSTQTTQTTEKEVREARVQHQEGRGARPDVKASSARHCSSHGLWLCCDKEECGGGGRLTKRCNTQPKMQNHLRPTPPRLPFLLLRSFPWVGALGGPFRSVGWPPPAPPNRIRVCGPCFGPLHFPP